MNPLFQDILDFVGFPVSLPERVERSFDDLPADTVRRVRASYAALDRRIAALPGSQTILEGIG